jgi:hypothetical protein
MLGLCQPELPELNNTLRGIEAETFYGVVPYDPNCNLGMPFMLRNPASLIDPILGELFNMPIVQVDSENPFSEACQLRRQNLADWTVILESLKPTEQLLMDHPDWPPANPLFRLDSRPHKLPSEFNLGCTFTNVCEARFMIRLARNAFLPIIADVTAVYACLHRVCSKDKIQEYMVQSGKLLPAWIDYFFSTSVFQSNQQCTGIALYMSTARPADGGPGMITNFPTVFMRVIASWGIPIQIWWPEDFADRNMAIEMAQDFAPNHADLNLANRFRAALHWPQPRCHPDAGQIVEGLFLSMDEFFHYCKLVPAHGEDSSNPDASDIEEDSVTDTPAAEVYLFIGSAPLDSRAEALPISMFWWMSDSPNLV